MTSLYKVVNLLSLLDVPSAKGKRDRSRSRSAKRKAVKEKLKWNEKVQLAAQKSESNAELFAISKSEILAETKGLKAKHDKDVEDKIKDDKKEDKSEKMEAPEAKNTIDESKTENTSGHKSLLGLYLSNQIVSIFFFIPYFGQLSKNLRAGSYNH